MSDILPSSLNAHILIIAAPSVTRHLVATILTMEGCSVSAANDPAIAADILAHTHVDLVIIIPDSGISASDCLQAHYPGLPAIVILPEPLPASPHQGGNHDSRPVRFLSSPISRSQLCPVVAELTGRQAMAELMQPLAGRTTN